MYDSAIYTAACGCQYEGSAVTKCPTHSDPSDREAAREAIRTYHSDRLGRVTIPE